MYVYRLFYKQAVISDKRDYSWCCQFHFAEAREQEKKTLTCVDILINGLHYILNKYGSDKNTCQVL